MCVTFNMIRQRREDARVLKICGPGVPTTFQATPLTYHHPIAEITIKVILDIITIHELQVALPRVGREV